MISNISYNVISTGSKGNAVVLNDFLMIDCGVPFKALTPVYKALRLVLLTHIHGDHFNRTTIRKLAAERPTLRWGCGRWLAEALVLCGVSKSNIDIYDFDVSNGYGVCNVIQFYLPHNVPNCGYKIHFPKGKVFYATDCNNLNGISAYRYDLYMIEANYEDEIIRQKIRDKKANGAYAYEVSVLQNHLSKEKCDDFIYRNAHQNSRYIYMHCHEDDKGGAPDDNRSEDC